MTMKTVAKNAGRIKRQQELREMTEEEMAFETRMAAIQTLIPIALERVNEDLQKEFSSLVGKRYARGKQLGPWGSNNGSVYLGDQKMPVRVPRVRDRIADTEVSLRTYQRLQSPGVIDDLAFRRVINGLSMGRYEKAAIEVPETFGIKRTSISRRFKRSSAQKLAALNERDLSGLDLVAIFLDGKHFSTDHEIVVALGITLSGEKVILGMVETSTENYRVCRDFLNRLIARGLRTQEPLLCLIDGGKGLRKGIEEVLGDQAVVQRCQWHKRQNVLAYLPQGRRDEYQRKLQTAYEQPSYEGAKARLSAIKAELQLINGSAVASLEEGFEETLTIHRLGLFETLGVNFKTTNAIENVNSLLAIYTDRVCYWKNSEQRQRWVATSLLEIEPRLIRLKNHQYLPQLRAALQTFVLERQKKTENQKAA
jgi:transposase-like protein